jgi:hypothetical protein
MGRSKLASNSSAAERRQRIARGASPSGIQSAKRLPQAAGALNLNSRFHFSVSWGLIMHTIAEELNRLLDQLDKQSAARLEQSVRDAVARAVRTATSSYATPTLGYPAGYFEATSGSFAGAPLDRPADLPLETRESW